MSRIVVSALLFCSAFVSSASAQIVYEPVKFQYEAGGTQYYYGGNNPWVHYFARQPYSPSGSWGRANGWAFFSSDTRTHRNAANEPRRVYSDSTGTTNAGLLGMTPDNARDEAYANASRYFVKRDALISAIPMADGSWVVPPHAHSMPIRVYKSDGTLIPQGPATRTINEPRPLMIIPKDLLQKPIPAKPSDKSLVIAN